VDTVNGSIALLNVTTTLLVTATLVVPLLGATEITVGCVLSALDELPVVKLPVNGVTWFPA
jgi:hypothetical protein